MVDFLTTLLNITDFVLPLLIALAYFTLAESKIMAGIKIPNAPNATGYLGLLQPLADGLKLLLKKLFCLQMQTLLLSY